MNFRSRDNGRAYPVSGQTSLYGHPPASASYSRSIHFASQSEARDSVRFANLRWHELEGRREGRVKLLQAMNQAANRAKAESENASLSEAARRRASESHTVLRSWVEHHRGLESADPHTAYEARLRREVDPSAKVHTISSTHNSPLAIAMVASAPIKASPKLIASLKGSGMTIQGVATKDGRVVVTAAKTAGTKASAAAKSTGSKVAAAAKSTGSKASSAAASAAPGPGGHGGSSSGGGKK